MYPPDPARVEAIFRRFETQTPKPLPELDFCDPYTLLIAVVLSAQTTDKAVNKVTARLFALAATPQAMVRLGQDQVIEAINPIGLFRNKARNLIALSQQLIDLHGGAVPTERASLEALPGVGRKTASVVLNELGIEPAIAVDTHVFRVSHRLGLSTAPTPDKVEAQLFAIVPDWALGRAHHWLILHGRYVCLARSPRCAGCSIADLCPSRPLFASAPANPPAGAKARA